MAHDPQNTTPDNEMSDADLADVAGAGSSNAKNSPDYFDPNS